MINDRFFMYKNVMLYRMCRKEQTGEHTYEGAGELFARGKHSKGHYGVYEADAFDQHALF